MAEELPFDDSHFGFVLMVTTVCFVDDISKALLEVGQTYLARRNKNVFYKDATFFSVDGLVEVMDESRFVDLTFKQAIFKTLPETTRDEPVKSGHGEGSLVVICGRKRGE